MLTVVAFTFALAAVAPWVAKVGRTFTAWLLAAAPLGVAVYLATQMPRVARGETIAESYSWVPTLGLSLSFYLDGLSLSFALLVTGIGALVLIYAGSYLQGNPQLGR